MTQESEKINYFFNNYKNNRKLQITTNQIIKMKKTTAPIFAALLILFALLSCETEVLSLDTSSVEVSSQETTTDSIINATTTLFSTNLMAGQHHLAGKVYGEINEDSLVITYTTVTDTTASKLWDIKSSHLYVGDCNAIPTTNAGNPKIGKFPLKEEHDAGTTEFSYSIPVSSLDECFCVAAHAVVDCNLNESTEANGECGEETAWAEGTDFSGNSWAMFVEVCNETEPCSLTVELIKDYDGEGYTISVDTDDETLTYKWSNGSTESEIYVFPNVTTTYTVDVINADGCLASESYTIKIE